MTAFPIFGDWKTTLSTWRAVMEGFRLSANVTDLNISDASDNNFLMYNSTTGKWENVGELHENIAITAGSETETKHTLGSIPSMILITYRKGGLVEDGDTANTAEKFYLENRGTTDAVVSVMVLP